MDIATHDVMFVLICSACLYALPNLGPTAIPSGTTFMRYHVNRLNASNFRFISRWSYYRTIRNLYTSVDKSSFFTEQVLKLWASSLQQFKVWQNANESTCRWRFESCIQQVVAQKGSWGLETRAPRSPGVSTPGTRSWCDKTLYVAPYA